MPKSSIVDSGALVALLDPRDAHHQWARETFARQAHPWLTCEAAISEACFLMGEHQIRAMDKLLRHNYLQVSFTLQNELSKVLDLRAKYSNVPMSLADACLVRMSETLPDPIVLTTDTDFRIYRRHSRLTIPSLIP